MDSSPHEPTADNWAAARGDKWSAHLGGLEAMLAPLDAPLIRALQLDDAYRIADIGCGGGGTSLQILQRAPAGTVVHGFDIAPTTVAGAQARIAGKDLSVAFKVADVSTSLPDEPYDRLTSRFGTMFFSDPRAAFANLRRWLVPGGRIAFAVWGKPADNPWMTTVRDAVAEVIDLPPTDPEGPGLFRYADPEKLVALLATAGFSALHIQTGHGQLPIGGDLGASEAALFALSSFSSFAEQLSQAGGNGFTKARLALTARFAPHERKGIVWMDASVHIVTGAKGME